MLFHDLKDADWQTQMKHATLAPKSLQEIFGWTSQEVESFVRSNPSSRVRLTPYYASLIEPGSHCPIRRQVLPEILSQPLQWPLWVKKMSQALYGQPTPYQQDPIGDLRCLGAPRLTHRYLNRVLIHLTTACGVNCQFCFRKHHLLHHEPHLYKGSLEPAFEYLKQHPEVYEVILTGGDPLVLHDVTIRNWIQRFNQMKRIRILRFHSRMPVVLPQRLTPEFLEVLGSFQGQVILLTHFNHVKELTTLAIERLKACQKQGILVLNQSVLLRGVNASLAALEQLFLRLYENGISPYYLHHPDWVQDSFHWRTSLEQAKEWMKQLQHRLSGPALPRYVLDVPQGYGKVCIAEALVLKKRFPVHRKKSLSTRIRGALYQVQGSQLQVNSPSDLFYLDVFEQPEQSLA